ncbi:hypothetical protein [Deinococcus sp. AJ005]|uniref:phage NrS-1 polymerase family protein n=1 Tax=Deinococcus sp. AJ005 TaxID=2652443 RepID=UPI00125CBA1F|nr:hypothetical protein [Deinococcus sp. AJ005]QFP75023.1 hypothetical protein DAAJ005_00205 [Deinococcus sp. AJ005]
MTLNVDGLPEDLREHQRYLPFCLRPRGNGRLGKVPHAMSNRELQPVDVRRTETWLSLTDAAALVSAGRADGLGLVLGLDLGVVAADLDSALRDGKVLPWAMNLVAELHGYTEVSISGTGLHVLVRGYLPLGRRRAGHLELLDSGFVALTGHRLAGSLATVPHRQGALQAVYGRTFPAPVAHGSPAPSLPLADTEVLARLLAIKNAHKLARLLDGDVDGYISPSEADFALARLLRFGTQNPEQIARLMRASALARARWDRPAGLGLTYLHRTIDRALVLGGPTLPPAP